MTAHDTPVLTYLQRMDGKLDRLIDSLTDLGRRVSSLDTKVALLHSDFAAQSGRLDRIDLRLDRIEHRLDIVYA